MKPLLDSAFLRSVHDVREGTRLMPRHHLAERASGWVGSDGSTSSTDTICGVRVGITSTAFLPELPCYVHDFDYRVIRRELAWGTIDHLEAIEAKHAADERLRVDLRLVVERELTRWFQSPLLAFALWRCEVRYEAVTLFGHTAIQPRHDETYLRPAPRREPQSDAA